MNINRVESYECPLVSVIVVTRNRASSLQKTLQVLRGLAYPHFGIIVVDNGSTDHTMQIVINNEARYVYSPSNYGISYSRQLGINAAQGEIVAFCDDDCLPISDWLTYFVQRLQRDPDIGLVGGQIINIGFSGNRRYKGRTKLGRNGLLSFVADPKEADFFGNANLAFRRSAVEAIGGYDPFFNVMAEIDLAMSLKRHGFRVAYEPNAVVEHHHVGSSQKKRHLFRGPQLIRLYFFFKHCRPTNLGEWLSFLGCELQLLWQDLRRASRALAATLVKRQFNRLSTVGTEFFNLLSARMAIPWLLWQTKKQMQATVRSAAYRATRA
jgi:GT2 family glycosyltransferase